MALEAGELMHQMYAGVRIWQLMHIQKLKKHALVVAHRIFGKDRWKKITKACESHDARDNLCELAFAVLETAGWVDDEKDKTRTMANMMMATIHYIDARLENMEQWPIYVEDILDPHCLVGIEQVFDVVVLFRDGREIRYIGTIDGMVIRKETGEYILDENKTANRIDDGWRLSFEMSHQVTGYSIVAPAIFGFKVERCRVTGNKIKPTNAGENVYPLITLRRTESAFATWAYWLRHTVDLYEQYEGNYELAPRYTHSCNRYFRPCSLIPFCADDPAGRAEQWIDMIDPDRSPSERAVMEG